MQNYPGVSQASVTFCDFNECAQRTPFPWYSFNFGVSGTACAFDFPMFKMLISHVIVIVDNVGDMAGGFAVTHFRAPVVLKALGRGRRAS